MTHGSEYRSLCLVTRLRLDMQCPKASRLRTYFSSSDAKSVSVHLPKGTGSLSTKKKQPDRDAVYSLQSVAQVKQRLRHICLLPLCTFLALISTNLHSRLYVVLVVHCIYHITFYEALPFLLQSFYIRHPLSDNLIIECLQCGRPPPQPACRGLPSPSIRSTVFHSITTNHNENIVLLDFLLIF